MCDEQHGSYNGQGTMRELQCAKSNVQARNNMKGATSKECFIINFNNLHSTFALLPKVM
jgi:hypothetical protein